MCSSPLIALWFFSGPTPIGLHLSCICVKQYSRSGLTRVEGDSDIPCPSGLPSFDAAQDNIGLLSQGHTVGSHQAFIYQNPQDFLCRAAFKEFFSWSVSVAGIALTQEQCLVLGLFESCYVDVGSLCQTMQVPLDCFMAP